MRQVTGWSSAVLVGAALTLAACGGGDRNRSDSATAAGEVSAGGATSGASGGATATGAMGDSAAMSGSGATTGAAGANSADLSSLSEPDIMAMVGTSNAGEIATSEVAVDKATKSSVKAFARKMVADHRAMQKEADQLATKLNVTPGTPQQATDKKNMANQMTQQLTAAAKGQDFDRQYIDGQVQAHQQTLTELQSMQNTANADVKALITKAIPKVQAHLDEAKRLQGQLGGAGSTGSTGGDTSGATSGATGGSAGTAGATKTP